jgi:hypothetical protein
MSNSFILPISLHTLCFQLRAAITQLSDRGLFQASRWAAELLVAAATSNLHNSPKNDSLNSDHFSLNNPSQELKLLSTSTMVSTKMISVLQDSSMDVEKLLLAKSYLELREYERVSHLLSTCNPANTKALFIRYYARYLVCIEVEVGFKITKRERDSLMNDSFFVFVQASEKRREETQNLAGIFFFFCN